MRVESADGVEVRYEVRGAGTPALVLVHGWSCDRRYWRHQLASFAARHTVVAVDLAGHGDSGHRRSAWTMAAFGADVVAVADALGLTDMVLVGHSMGGDVVVEAARSLGSRVRALVWVDTYRTLEVFRGDPEAFVARFRADFPAATDAFARHLAGPYVRADLADRIAADMAAAPPAIALDAMWHSVTNGPAAVEGLREVGRPAFAINPADPPTDVGSLARHGVVTTTVDGVGHFLMLEDPPGFDRTLRQVIDSVSA